MGRIREGVSRSVRELVGLVGTGMSVGEVVCPEVEVSDS